MSGVSGSLPNSISSQARKRGASLQHYVLEYVAHDLERDAGVHEECERLRRVRGKRAHLVFALATGAEDLQVSGNLLGGVGKSGAGLERAVPDPSTGWPEFIASAPVAGS